MVSLLFDLVWFILVSFGLVLVWFGLAWFGFGLVWFCLVWFGLILFYLRWFGIGFVTVSGWVDLGFSLVVGYMLEVERNITTHKGRDGFG